MSKAGYAEVVVDLPVFRVDKVYHYAVPSRLQSLVRTGVRVLVPFGGQRLTGYVVGLCAQPAVKVKVKDILAVLDKQPAFTEELYGLAWWMANRYLCTVAEALKCIAAPSLASSPKYCQEIHPVDCDSARVNAMLRRAPKQELVWKLAQACPGLTRSELAAKAGVSLSVINRLVSKGLLVVRKASMRRDPYPQDAVKDYPPPPTAEQAEVLEAIQKSMAAAEPVVLLLYGVTGSGKTEVYLRAVARTLEAGKQALVLVPEVALTTQMVRQFKVRFGDKVAVLHSRLGGGERHDEWIRIFNGQVPVVLGTRSAVFAPLGNLGLIVIDEEHEPSYKQEDNPKYHAREVAIYRAMNHKCPVLLGTATPSLRTYAKALKGENYHLLRLTHRVDHRPLPTVTVVDLREEYRRGRRSVLSCRLEEKIKEKLARGQQVILFLNRRGFSSITLCRECGRTLYCPHCAITLTYHRDGYLRCHYCGYQMWLPEQCPACYSPHLESLGTGTQKVEKEVEERFPGVKLLRMDGDTVTRRRSHERILQAFRDRKADILIGTQMIAKGLDLPAVTLVGIINADTTLMLPDFRAAERTFQLIVQVAGRAGRGTERGEVIVQTFCPDHYSIEAAKNQDYEQFFIKEMALRRQMKYPPFVFIARVLVRGRTENAVRNAAERLRGDLVCKAGDEIDILGPAPAPVPKIKDYYRWHIVLKARQNGRLRRILRETLEGFNSLPGQKNIIVTVDVDPEIIM
ncbi:MAG: primosomal protein N' [Peptococcaceae bacterium]|nr:primosomal protein N' [Peptococcaceae bacterium]